MDFGRHKLKHIQGGTHTFFDECLQKSGDFFDQNLQIFLR